MARSRVVDAPSSTSRDDAPSSTTNASARFVVTTHSSFSRSSSSRPGVVANVLDGDTTTGGGAAVDARKAGAKEVEGDGFSGASVGVGE